MHDQKDTCSLGAEVAFPPTATLWIIQWVCLEPAAAALPYILLPSWNIAGDAKSTSEFVPENSLDKRIPGQELTMDRHERGARGRWFVWS